MDTLPFSLLAFLIDNEIGVLWMETNFIFKSVFVFQFDTAPFSSPGTMPKITTSFVQLFLRPPVMWEYSAPLVCYDLSTALCFSPIRDDASFFLFLFVWTQKARFLPFYLCNSLGVPECDQRRFLIMCDTRTTALSGNRICLFLLPPRKVIAVRKVCSVDRLCAMRRNNPLHCSSTLTERTPLIKRSFMTPAALTLGRWVDSQVGVRRTNFD